MIGLLISFALAAGAGASIVLQQALNNNMRMALNSAAWSGVVSYAVGLICMTMLALALRDPLELAGAARVPWWGWAGGLFGSIFIALSIVLAPKLGAATFFALLVTGQMIASIAFDHFGLFGIPQRPADLSRLLGVLLLIGGVVLIRR